MKAEILLGGMESYITHISVKKFITILKVQLKKKRAVHLYPQE
jgi:hypothetical protein